MSASSPRIGIVSLGCPKALVDSERILTRLGAEGYGVAPTYQEADLVVVNTCGFLDSAKAESLEAIGEALAMNGRVVVTGCMGGDEAAIRAVHPQVLAVSGPERVEEVLAAVHAALPPPRKPRKGAVPPEGLKLTPPHYAYLKIAEGCNQRCEFCIIPKIRGPLRSRAAGDVLAEAEAFAEAGVKEILVVSQDSGAYGSDLRHEASLWRGRAVEARLVPLAAALGELGVWVRVHYVYPYPSLDELVALMAEGRILPYLDVPFQHASPPVLKAMRRPAHDEKTLERIGRWRALCPDLTIRSTFLVGFPGETEEDFERLLDWLEAAELDRVGCFQYEPVAGAPANELPGAVPDEVKQERWERLMETQQAISERRLRLKIGQTLEVLIDEVDDEGAIGRSRADAPEVDGCVFLDGETGLEPGDMVLARIDEADAYDLHGAIVPSGQ